MSRCTSPGNTTQKSTYGCATSAASTRTATITATTPPPATNLAMVIYARPVIIAAATAFIVAAPAAHADDTGSDLLVGSTQGFVLGPTGIPDPAIFPGYTPTIENDYLVPLGFSPNGTLTDLYTTEALWSGISIAQGVLDLEKPRGRIHPGSDPTVGPRDDRRILTIACGDVA